MTNIQDIEIMELSITEKKHWYIIIKFDNNTQIDMEVKDYNIDVIADQFKFPYNQLIKYKFFYFLTK